MKTRPCVKCGRNRAERFFTGPRGRTCSTCRRKSRSGATRGVRLVQTYGISTDDYERILAEQGGGCAICWRKPRYNLDVDHCHKTGVVRGLLCKLCNRRLLPAARDDERTLNRAVYYLNHPPALQALGRVVTVPGSLT
jgi:hypothetical protein